ncbi:MAG: hypothetical protein ABI877_12450 [Gemmatimonadaceae bacterium]
MASRATKVIRKPARPLASRPVFLRQLVRGVVIGSAAVGVGLLIGAVGYHATEGLSWLDATLNASMLLAGEGPIAPLHTVAGKLFATAYALFSGVLFITSVSVLLAPLAHRFMHRLHLEISADEVEDP